METKEYVLNCVAEVTGIDVSELSLTMRLADDLFLDSIKTLTLIDALEKKSGVGLDKEACMNVKISDLINMISTKKST